MLLIRTIFLCSLMSVLFALPVNICVVPTPPNVYCNISTTPLNQSSVTGFSVAAFRQAAQNVSWTEGVDYVFLCTTQEIATLSLANYSTNNLCYATLTQVTSELSVQGIKYSYPYYRAPLSVVLVGITPTQDMWSFLYPFDWTLWLAIGLTAAGLPVILWMFETKYIRDKWHVKKFIKMWWESVGQLVALDGLEVLSPSSHLAHICYGFMILILVNTYIANLAAIQNSSTGTSEILSTSELLNQNVGTLEQYYDRLVYQGVVPFVLDSNDVQADINSQYIPLLLSEELTALALDFPIITHMLYNDNTCSLRILTDDYGAIDYAIAFNPTANTTTVTSFNHAILSMLSQNQIYELGQTYFVANNPNCPDFEVATDVTVTAYTFYNVAGLWIVLGVAVGLALLLQLAHELIVIYGHEALKHHWLQIFPHYNPPPSEAPPSVEMAPRGEKGSHSEASGVSLREVAALAAAEDVKKQLGMLKDQLSIMEAAVKRRSLYLPMDKNGSSFRSNV